MIKKVLLCCLLSLQGLYAQMLDFHADSSHFQIHYSEMDIKIVPGLLETLEEFYSTISEEFEHTMHHQLQINIYPDIQSHHDAIGLTNGADWVVANADHGVIDIVSPLNPGPSHTELTIRKIMQINVVKSVLYDKFGQDQVPYWLAFGIGALKAEYSFSCPPKYIPTLIELEAKHSVDYFHAAYSLVKFVQETYGWEMVLQLAANYDIYKEELYNSWIQSFSNP